MTAVITSELAPPEMALPRTYLVVSVVVTTLAFAADVTPSRSPIATVAPATNLVPPTIKTSAYCPDVGAFCNTPIGISVAAEQVTTVSVVLNFTKVY